MKRGEPVSITVVNQLPEPTAVHWHGIELESYYDGVAGFAGEGKRIAPAIPPGGSFEARFTPAAQAALAPLLVEGPVGAPALEIAGKRYSIRERRAKGAGTTA